jgi:hypothetical protein
MQRSISRLCAAFGAVALACALGASAQQVHAAPPVVTVLTDDPSAPGTATFVPYTAAKPGDRFVVRIDRDASDTTTIVADFDPRLRWFTVGGLCFGPDDANHMVCNKGGGVFWVWFTVSASTSAAPITFYIQSGDDKPRAYSIPYTPAVRPANAIYMPLVNR